ncbi:hypothetical protein DB88DRAFT_510385 [Papiliotrema laurentii]|uniref:Uncharacterized protein n=1 Tax=Papiliotrema laurentii TaxID=5418 RepID=A0AAD9CYX9_PAPLA|nr:hypothetical protein DB88DRAFT_510385 [Papiliotrema laurentii]
MSLRVVFGRKGFIARRLSGAFEKHQHGSLSPDARRAPGRASTHVASHTGMDGRAGGLDRTDQAEKNRQWRQDVLSQAVSLSLSSRMVHCANTRDSTFIPPSQPKRPQRHRPRIPEVFLSAPGALLAVASGIVSGPVASYASTTESPPRQQIKTERDETTSSGRPIPPEQQPHRRSRLFDMLRHAKLVNQRPTQGGSHAILPSVKVIPNTKHEQAYGPGHIGPDDLSYPEEQSLLPCQARSVLDRLAARDLVSVDGDVQPLASDIVDRVIMWRESVLSGSMQRVTGDQ